MFDLPKDLEHDHGLARASISDDLHVLCLRPLWYAEHRLHPVGFDAYAISSNPAVELLRRHHLGTFQSPSVSQLLAPSNVFGGRKWQLDEQRCQTEKQWELREIEKAITTVNRTLEIGIQGRVDIALLRSQVKENIAALEGGLREGKRDGFAAWLRRLALGHVGIGRQTRRNSARAQHEQPVVVPAAVPDGSRDTRPDVAGHIE